jgi:hypothetical protein
VSGTSSAKSANTATSSIAKLASHTKLFNYSKYEVRLYLLLILEMVSGTSTTPNGQYTQRQYMIAVHGMARFKGRRACSSFSCTFESWMKPASVVAAKLIE